MSLKQLQWDHIFHGLQLEKFTNHEFYYIISKVLGLGDPGFSPETLYLSFEEQSLERLSEVKFLFLTKTLLHSTGEDKEVTLFHLGKLDASFDEIEIYSGRCAPDIMDPEGEQIDSIFMTQNFHGQTCANILRPMSILKGICEVASSPSYRERIENDMFKFYWDSPLSSEIKHRFDFGKIGILNTDFSGNYYLVASPDSVFGETKINSFKVHDNYDRKIDREYVQHRIDVYKSAVDFELIQLYESGKIDQLQRDESGKGSKEDPEIYKQEIIPILTQTVLSLLNDLPLESKEHVLEGETPEELIVYCKEKYDKEFDLNFNELGIVGAHEIAWEEALSILKDEDNQRFDLPK